LTDFLLIKGDQTDIPLYILSEKTMPIRQVLHGFFMSKFKILLFYH